MVSNYVKIDIENQILEHPCGYCGGEIKGRRKDAKYCSPKCCATSEKQRYKERKTGITPNFRGPNNGRSMRIRKEKQGRYAQAKELGYRSMFEYDIVQDAEANGFTLEYEPFSIPYFMKGSYCPDLVLPNGIVVEAKGYFDSRARAKMIAVKKHNPDLDIRMLFMNSKTKVRKGSKLTYAGWCEKYGFPFADGMIPQEWFNE